MTMYALSNPPASPSQGRKSPPPQPPLPDIIYKNVQASPSVSSLGMYNCLLLWHSSIEVCMLTH